MLHQAKSKALALQNKTIKRQIKWKAQENITVRKEFPNGIGQKRIMARVFP
jgi:hypothetical protein